MPIKHQSDSYRMVKGDKFICWGDILCEEHEADVEACKRHRIPHRVVKIDGFRRLFVKETEVSKLT